MGRGFTWYQLQEDDAELLNFVAKRDDLVIVPFVVPRQPQDVVEVAIGEFLLHSEYGGGSIVLRGTVRKYGVAKYGVPGDVSYGLPLSAEAVRYHRGTIGDGKLGPSHLSADWHYLSGDKTDLIDKSPEFRKWAGRIFDWARRHAPAKLECNGYPYPATKRAAEAFRRREFKTTM